MKKTINLLVMTAVIGSLSFRTDKLPQITTDDTATVFVYRGGQAFAAGVNYVIQADGKDICRLSNNKYIEYGVKPGKVVFAARRGGLELFKRETEIELTTEAGKKYYIKGDVKTSLIRTRLELSEVTENTAKRDMAKMSPDNCQESIGK